jgi:hypothetical protein
MSEAWFAASLRLLDAARGNDRFIKVRALRHLWSAWQRAVSLSPETVPSPVVDEHTGLPPWSTWAEVMAEQRLGATLPPADIDEAGLVGDGARARLRRREAAARLLAAVPPLPLESGRVEVRRLEGRRAFVTLTLDRIGATGLFVRVGADVSVVVDGAARSIVVEDDRARVTAPLVAVLERSAALPAPALAVQLAASGVDVVVERVTRGVVGPMSVAARGRGLQDLAGADGGVLVMSFEELHAEVAENADNDVFAGDDLQTLWQALPPSLRGLKVFRDARVVATPTAAERVRALAARRGTKTVVTVVPDRP